MAFLALLTLCGSAFAASSATSASATAALWSWVIDGVPSELKIDGERFDYSAGIGGLHLKVKPCNQALIQIFARRIVENIGHPAGAVAFPEGYSPIWLQLPGESTRTPLLRGSKEAVFLFMLPSEVERLRQNSRLLCR